MSFLIMLYAQIQFFKRMYSTYQIISGSRAISVPLGPFAISRMSPTLRNSLLTSSAPNVSRSRRSSTFSYSFFQLNMQVLFTKIHASRFVFRITTPSTLKSSCPKILTREVPLSLSLRLSAASSAYV